MQTAIDHAKEIYGLVQYHGDGYFDVERAKYLIEIRDSRVHNLGWLTALKYIEQTMENRLRADPPKERAECWKNILAMVRGLGGGALHDHLI